MLGYGKDSHTYRVFNINHHKVVETVDVRFNETNGSQREHLPPVLDEISPEESIKFKATDDVIPTKNLLKKSFQNVKNIMLVHLKKMALNKMLSLLNIVSSHILALQMKCRSRKSSAISTQQVLSRAQKLHTCLTFVGILPLSLSQSPPKLMKHSWSLSGFELCKINCINSSSIMCGSL